MGGTPSSLVVVLLTLIEAIGAAIAAVTGMLAGPDPLSFSTARGQTVDLFGAGIYHYDSLFFGAGNRGTDAVTLLIVLPLLTLALVGYRRGSLRAAFGLTGVQAWLLYVYATMALGAAYNPLFLVYVTVFATSLWALVLTVRRIDTRRLETAMAGLPRRGPAVLMMISGLVTAVIWLGPVLVAQLSGAVPARLDGYTTLVTVALDSAVITPAALIAAVLIWRRRVVGYQIAVPLLFVETLLAPMIATQTISQLSAGIFLTPGEIAGPLAGFAILAVAAGAVLFSVLRALPGRPDHAWLLIKGSHVPLGHLEHASSPPPFHNTVGKSGEM
jgi:hypothetical protein